MATPTRLTTKRWSAWLLLLLAVIALVVRVASAQEQQPAAAVQDDAAQQLQTEPIPEFVPTDEWQDILPGQAVPPGLHVRLNLATGKREAKLLNEDEKDSVAIAEPIAGNAGAGEASVTVVTDVSGEIKDASVAATHAAPSHAVTVVDAPDAETPKETVKETASDPAEVVDEAPPAKEPNWNHEKIYEVLQALPEPPDVDGMDIHEARAKLSTPEFRRKMIKLWKKRQEELKEAIDTLQDDAKYLAKLLDQFREAEKNGDVDGQLNVLEVLEWEVQDLDKTHVFNFIGGFGMITEYLNSTNLPVRASASWLIGTAVKNYKDGQDWAINAGAIPRLVDSLSLEVPTDDANKAAAVYEVKKKAVYALSSLVRFNARGQRLLLSLDGPRKLSQLMEEHNPLAVQLKAVLFAHDLLNEEPSVSGTGTGNDADALPELQSAFKTPEWCSHTATFLAEKASKLQRNQVVETIQAMEAQLPACKKDFSMTNVEATVQAIQTKWRQETDLEDEEREDLVAVGASLLSKL